MIFLAAFMLYLIALNAGQFHDDLMKGKWLSACLTLALGLFVSFMAVDTIKQICHK